MEAVKPVLPVEQDFEVSSLRSDSLEANEDSSRAVSSLTPEGDGAAEVKVETADNSVATGAEVEGVNDPSESTDGVKAFARISSVDEQLRESPGFKFITRPDLYKFAKVCENSISNEMFIIHVDGFKTETESGYLFCWGQGYVYRFHFN